METVSKPDVYFIVGPTACGKSSVGLGLAEKMNAEIISADSIQVYRGLNIGSAKVSIQEQMRVKHHLLDVTDVNDRMFSAACFQELASEAIQNIIQLGRKPLVVGGTGLYINSLIFPLNFANVSGALEYREKLQELEQNEEGYVYEQLKKIDPQSAARLHPNDKKRIIRALEVYHITGKTIGEYGYDFQNAANNGIPYTPHMVGLDIPRSILYERIEKRVDEMMNKGLLDETQSLYSRYHDKTLPAFQGLGYKQLIYYIEGETSLDEAVNAIKLETRHLAKRQITWFKRDKRIVWVNIADISLEEIISKIFNIFGGCT